MLKKLLTVIVSMCMCFSLFGMIANAESDTAQGYQFNEQELERANIIVDVSNEADDELSLYDFLMYAMDDTTNIFLPAALREISWDGEVIGDGFVEEPISRAVSWNSTISKYGASLRGRSMTTNNKRDWHSVTCYVVDKNENIASYAVNSKDYYSDNISVDCIVDPPTGSYRARGVHVWPTATDMGNPGYVTMQSSSSLISYIN